MLRHSTTQGYPLQVNDVLEGLHVTQKAIPKILFTFINTDCKSDLDQLKQKMAGICGALAKDNSVEKKRLWSQLTTKFYHPNQHDELQALRAKDNERKLLFLKTLRTNHKKSLRALEDIETVVLAKLTFCADKLLEAADITIYPEYIKEIRPKLKVASRKGSAKSDTSITTSPPPQVGIPSITMQDERVRVRAERKAITLPAIHGDYSDIKQQNEKYQLLHRDIIAGRGECSERVSQHLKQYREELVAFYQAQVDVEEQCKNRWDRAVKDILKMCKANPWDAC